MKDMFLRFGWVHGRRVIISEKAYVDRMNERQNGSLHTTGECFATMLRLSSDRDGYVDRVKQGQHDALYITGECCAVVSSSPFVKEYDAYEGKDQMTVTK